jgi:dipeptidyl aminopeptidase/acylaminoacyl peptidase
MLARSRTVAEPRWSPDGRHVAWVDAFAGRADVAVAPADGSGPPVVVTADTPVVSVGAYGGGAYTWSDADRLVVAASDGRLVLVAADGAGSRTLSDIGRAAAPACPAAPRWVAFVREGDDRCELVVAPLEGPDEPKVLSRADYAWDPACSPDGALVAWHEWDLPNMPWDGSRIVVASPDGAAPLVVAGRDGEAVGQPRWSPDGRRLGFVTDRDGWWNVWSVDRSGRDARPVAAEPHEQAEPPWGPGQRSFAWSPDGTAVALVRNEDGFGRLVVAGPDGAETRARGWHHGLDWGAAGIVAVRSGARTPAAVTVLGPGGRRVVARGPVGGFETIGLAEPEVVTWPGRDGTAVPGLLWRPAAHTPGRDAPPLLVDVHGGPTGQATAAWRPAVSFFTCRGWAVLAPNPTGSTGYGRAYAQALAGEWGGRDVEEVAAGIRAAADRGWGDPERVAVGGGSAGALTALLLCVRYPDLVRAAVSQYGVTDLAALAATTHRFESRYLDRLVGVLPRDAARYRERSPATHAAALRVPVLVLHGRDDRVVPVGQAEAFVAAIEAAGGTVEAHLYDGEGHGWRLPDTIEDAYRRMDAFLRRYVGDP